MCVYAKRSYCHLFHLQARCCSTPGILLNASPRASPAATKGVVSPRRPPAGRDGRTSHSAHAGGGPAVEWRNTGRMTPLGYIGEFVVYNTIIHSLRHIYVDVP